MKRLKLPKGNISFLQLTTVFLNVELSPIIIASNSLLCEDTVLSIVHIGPHLIPKCYY